MANFYNRKSEAAWWWTGDVVWPASATDNAIARYDWTTWELIQDSSATIDDNWNLTAENYRKMLSNQDTDTVTTSGSYWMIGTPTNWPIAWEYALQVYKDWAWRIMQIATMLDSTVWTRIYVAWWSSWIKTGISDADDVTLSSLATWDILQYIGSSWINNPVFTDTKTLTGFVDNANLSITYDSTARTVTVTHASGTITYYWKGQKKTLTSPWTSSAHSATLDTRYYLYSSDWDNFAWSTTPWTFDMVQVAYAFYGTSDKFAWNELHGTMDYEAHLVLHNNVGTFRYSGGWPTAGTYTLNTSTDVAITPWFDSALIYDEDKPVTIPAWTEWTYTTGYTNASNVMVFSTTASFPFTYTSAWYINWYSAGTLTQGATWKFYNVYQILVPVTGDVNSQKYRTILLQPQAEYSTLAAAQAEDFRGINLWNFTSLVPESVTFTRLTYWTSASYWTTWKVQLNWLTYLTGARASQVSISGVTPADHSNLSDLAWTTSGHTGTASTIPWFDANWLANEIALSGLTYDWTTLTSTWWGAQEIRIRIPWELVADTANYQWVFWRNNTGASITVSNVAFWVWTAAAWAWAAAAFNIYKSSWTAADRLNTNAVNLFTSAVDLTTNYTDDTNVPDTATVEAWRWVTLRCTSSAWATNKASDLEAIISYS